VKVVATALSLGQASQENETHPFRAGWVGRNPICSLPALRQTHTTSGSGTGREKHSV